MRLVVATEKGVLELNWMWLPTFIGMNNSIKASLKSMSEKFEGKEMSDSVLDEAHDHILHMIKERYPKIKGLDTFLDGLKCVEFVP